MLKLHRLIVLLLLVALTSGAMLAQDTTADLQETVTLATDVGRISLSVPDGWLAQVNSDAQAYMGTTRDSMLKPYGAVFAPGEVQISLATARAHVFVRPDGLTDGEIVLAIMKYLMAQPGATGARPETLALTRINDVPVATSKTETAESTSYVMMRMVTEQTFLFIEVITAPDELEDWIGVGEDVLASAQFGDDSMVAAPLENTAATAEVELTETYSDSSIPLTISYPAGWVVRPSSPNGVDFGTSEEALNLWLSHAFGPEDAHGFIGYGTSAEMFETPTPASLTPVEIFEQQLASAEEGTMEFDGPYETTVNGYDAAYLILTLPKSQTYLLLVDYNNGKYVTAQIQTGVGQAEKMGNLLTEMVATLDVGS